ncbi:uncharacterized protein RCC_02850 [Ramularia collo-cygni]|uniref:Uncharacterized protein n=1 Tax=Ramularia collo-cygni TaxID=112498 RepID=A0A2D3UR91_9PEZI|nr:uncharacterized protein RCC_02850 [Ramularia collo-cygni]CZT17018.1 uncharacterized protein RCC_02850 [Ramularia collo-cygni]
MAAPSQSRLPGRQGLRSRPTSMFEVPSEHMKRLQQIGDGNADMNTTSPSETGTTSKISKRRSLLPHFSRKSSQDDRVAPASIPEDAAPSAGGSDDRKAMLPPPRPSRLSSLRAPGRAAATHSRTASKDKIGAPGSAPAPAQKASSIADQFTSRVESGLKRTTSTRLPQTPNLRGPTPPIAAASTSTQRERAISNVSTASTKSHKRGSASISRTAAPGSTKPPQSSGTSPNSSKSPPSSSLARPRSSRTQMPPPSRPTFSTYQQHYSPAKTALPKPPIPAVKATKPAAPSVEDEIPITFDIALEQIELLQLSLLHESSAKALIEFEASAKKQLSARHTKLSREYDGIRAHEQRRRRFVNLTTLESWGADPALLAEHLQTVVRVVSDLRGHTEAGSRYSEMTGTFEKWATDAESFLMDEKSPANATEALPDSWRATHTALSLKLRAIQRDLSTLPPLPPNEEPDIVPSIQVLMQSCSSLVDGILKELELMTKIQKEVLQRGKERIDEQISALVSSTDVTGEKENWIPTPAWQSVP